MCKPQAGESPVFHVDSHPVGVFCIGGGMLRRCSWRLSHASNFRHVVQTDLSLRLVNDGAN